MSGRCRTTWAYRSLELQFEHDLFRKPVSTFRDHALERLARVEVVRRDLDSLGLQVGEEAWADAGRLEVALHGAVLQGGGAHVLVDLLHLDDVALEPGKLGDAHH